MNQQEEFNRKVIEALDRMKDVLSSIDSRLDSLESDISRIKEYDYYDASNMYREIGYVETSIKQLEEILED